MTFAIEFTLPGLPKTKCRVCGVLKPRSGAEVDTRGKYRYRDELGNLWQGHRCNACGCASKIADGRRRGKVPIAEVQAHPQKIGRQSELTAKAHFESLGYAVVHNEKIHGPDLWITKAGRTQTVEVKTASQIKGRQCWFVNRVGEHRKNDDLIAYVCGDTVCVEEMKVHLRGCDSYGKRVVTSYVHP